MIRPSGPQGLIAQQTPTNAANFRLGGSGNEVETAGNGNVSDVLACPVAAG